MPLLYEMKQILRFYVTTGLLFFIGLSAISEPSIALAIHCCAWPILVLVFLAIALNNVHVQ